MQLVCVVNGARNPIFSLLIVFWGLGNRYSTQFVFWSEAVCGGQQETVHAAWFWV